MIGVFIFVFSMGVCCGFIREGVSAEGGVGLYGLFVVDFVLFVVLAGRSFGVSRSWRVIWAVLWI